MTLDHAPKGHTHRVRHVHGDPLLRERLVELGFIPGSEVVVLRRAPLGNALHVRVRSGSFALRRDEAGRIEVAENSDAA